jgi:hypothetical protein
MEIAHPFQVSLIINPSLDCGQPLTENGVEDGNFRVYQKFMF